MDRIKFVQLIILVFGFLIVTRLFYWQFIAKITAQVDSVSQEIKIPAIRGDIFAKDGFPLVTNQEAFLVYAQPREIERNPQEIAKTLAPFLISEKYSTPGAILSLEEDKKKEKEIKTKEIDLSQKLKNENFFWVQIARKIPKFSKERIEELSLKGINFEHDDKRYYPEASMAAHLLGFVGQDKYGEDTGYFGLEGYYDNQLKGKTGRLGLFKDPFGFPILVGKYRGVEAKKGISLYTTIDRSVQFIVEEKLRETVEKYQAKSGTVVVFEPSTGNILAMATYPTYNPSIYSEFDETIYKNPAVADTYEPGSTFKLITMSAALDADIVKPDSKCPVCTGPRIISGHKISTWNDKYYPNSSMVEIIEHSDNVGMSYVAEKLGIDKFYDYITKFGFGKKSEIDLQEESAGNIRPKKEWRAIDLATASFGQGLAVTSIQMVQAVGVFANDGKLITPKITQKIVDSKGEKKIESEVSQVVSPKIAAQITEMMVSAVEKGEARAFVPKGYRIAGKTGTAQIPVAGHYDPNKTIASFVGFAPADDPKFVMLVRFTEPSTSPFGSETAAPTFFAIAKDILTYMGIPPSEK